MSRGSHGRAAGVGGGERVDARGQVVAHGLRLQRQRAQRTQQRHARRHAQVAVLAIRQDGCRLLRVSRVRLQHCRNLGQAGRCRFMLSNSQ